MTLKTKDNYFQAPDNFQELRVQERVKGKGVKSTSHWLRTAPFLALSLNYPRHTQN